MGVRERTVEQRWRDVPEAVIASGDEGHGDLLERGNELELVLGFAALVYLRHIRTERFGQDALALHYNVWWITKKQ